MAKREHSKADQLSCVIYVRMSQDRTGEELGVERHQKDCRDLAAQRGMTVEHVYSDNDKSATSGAPRPEFDAMLAARPKAIVAWHQDRLLRLTKDLERVIDLGIPIYFVTSAENGLDLATPAGRAVARTVAAWSQYEGEQKRLRQLSKNEQLAEHGHWQFSFRPFGYTRQNNEIVQVPAEAALIRDGYKQVLKGESYRSVARRWNRLVTRWGNAGFRTIKGDRWTGSRVQRMLENSHYGGIPSYKGEEVELAEGKELKWVPILSPREWSSFRELKVNRKRPRSWATSPKHLMSGMLSCGVCGERLFSHAQDEMTRNLAAREAWLEVRTLEAQLHGTEPPSKLSVKAPVLNADGSRVKHTTYVCFANHCVSIRGEYVDQLVRTIVVKKLTDDRIIKALRPNDEATPLQEEIIDLQRRRDDVTELLGDGLMDKVAARAKLEDITARLERKQSRLAAVRAESPLSDLRLASSIPNKWDAMSVLDRRRVIADLGLKLTINAAQRGQRAIDPETGKTYSERAWALLRVSEEWEDD